MGHDHFFPGKDLSAHLDRFRLVFNVYVLFVQIVFRVPWGRLGFESVIFLVIFLDKVHLFGTVKLLG